MKNILSLILFMFSISINAQNKIENDELFIRYKQEYENNNGNTHIAQQLEVKSQTFYEKIKTDAKRSFYKSKNKEKWLKKNVAKTGFKNFEEADYAYKELMKLEEDQSKNNKTVLDLYDELLKKYDREVIYQAVKDHIWNKNNN